MDHGEIQVTRASGVPMYLRRNSSDGDILSFYKDGTAVGSIGTEGGNLTIDGSTATGKTGIEFSGAEWFPRESGANSDGLTSLGNASNRFKDLYLSGKALVDSLQFAQNSAATGATEAVYRATTGVIAFKTASAEAMRISSGDLLVGTTDTPNGTSVYGAGFINTGASGLVQWRSGTSVTSAVSVARFYNPNGNVGSIQLSGTATSYVTSSDQRLKENIADADDAGLKIDSIQVRKFDWKADGSHQDYGMVAQELASVAPEAVSAPEDPEEMMGVDYSKLVPMMLKEIQSLRARIAALEP